MLTDLWEFIRVNQFVITAPITLISIGTSVYLARKNRAQHRITYETKEDLVFRSRKDLGPDLLITYKGETVQELYQYSIAIKNEGNQKYASSDFVTPIKISLKGHSRIFSSSLTPRCSRPNLLSISTNDDDAIITVELLNPGDKIDVSLLSDSPSEIILDANIAGVRSLIGKNFAVPHSRLIVIVIKVILAIAIAAYIVYGKDSPRPSLLTLALAIISSDVTLEIVHLYIDKKMTKRVTTLPPSLAPQRKIPNTHAGTESRESK